MRAGSHLQLPQGLRCKFDCPSQHHSLITQAYHILDEVLLAGELQETSKKAVLRVCSNQVGPLSRFIFLKETASQDELMEDDKKRKSMTAKLRPDSRPSTSFM